VISSQDRRFRYGEVSRQHEGWAFSVGAEKPFECLLAGDRHLTYEIVAGVRRRLAVDHVAVRQQRHGRCRYTCRAADQHLVMDPKGYSNPSGFRLSLRDEPCLLEALVAIAGGRLGSGLLE
jgi:hypothetical protein